MRDCAGSSSPTDSVDDMVCGIYRGIILESANQLLILDSFPETLDQTEMFLSNVNRKNKCFESKVAVTEIAVRQLPTEDVAQAVIQAIADQIHKAESQLNETWQTIEEIKAICSQDPEAQELLRTCDLMASVALKGPRK
ncbi:MAG: hypothetical protein KDK65_05820 [Chlamydiia bacterium]|nr:hypothetical protein [Chlamydiia bacterium]